MEVNSLGGPRFEEQEGWQTLVHAQQTCLPNIVWLSCNGVKGDLLGGHVAAAVHIYVACHCPNCVDRLSQVPGYRDASDRVNTAAGNGRRHEPNPGGSGSYSLSRSSGPCTSRPPAHNPPAQPPPPGPLFNLEDWYVHCHSRHNPGWQAPLELHYERKADRLVKNSIMVLQPTRAPAGAKGEGAVGDGEVVQEVPLGDWMVAFCRRYHGPGAGSLVKQYVQVLWWNDPWNADHDTHYRPDNIPGYGNWYGGRIKSVSLKTGHLEVAFTDGEVHDVALGVNFVHFGKRPPTGNEHARLPQHSEEAAEPSHASGGSGSVVNSGRGGRGRRRGGGAGASGTRGSTGGGSDGGSLRTSAGGADGGNSRPPSADLSLQRLIAETDPPGESPNGVVPAAAMVAAADAAGQGLMPKGRDCPGGVVAGAGSISGGSMSTPGSLRRSATPPISLAPNDAEASMPSGPAPAARSDAAAVAARPLKRPRLSDGEPATGNSTAAAAGPAAAGPQAQAAGAPGAPVSGSVDREKAPACKEAVPRGTAARPPKPPPTVSTGGGGCKADAGRCDSSSTAGAAAAAFLAPDARGLHRGTGARGSAGSSHSPAAGSSSDKPAQPAHGAKEPHPARDSCRQAAKDGPALAKASPPSKLPPPQQQQQRVPSVPAAKSASAAAREVLKAVPRASPDPTPAALQRPPAPSSRDQAQDRGEPQPPPPAAITSAGGHSRGGSDFPPGQAQGQVPVAKRRCIEGNQGVPRANGRGIDAATAKPPPPGIVPGGSAGMALLPGVNLHARKERGAAQQTRVRVSDSVAPSVAVPAVPNKTASTAAAGAAGTPSASSGQAAWSASEGPGGAAPVKPTTDAAAATVRRTPDPGTAAVPRCGPPAEAAQKQDLGPGRQLDVSEGKADGHQKAARGASPAAAARTSGNGVAAASGIASHVCGNSGNGGDGSGSGGLKGVGTEGLSWGPDCDVASGGDKGMVIAGRKSTHRSGIQRMVGSEDGRHEALGCGNGGPQGPAADAQIRDGVAAAGLGAGAGATAATAMDAAAATPAADGAVAATAAATSVVDAAQDALHPAASGSAVASICCPDGTKPSGVGSGSGIVQGAQGGGRPAAGKEQGAGPLVDSATAAEHPSAAGGGGGKGTSGSAIGGGEREGAATPQPPPPATSDGVDVAVGDCAGLAAASQRPVVAAPATSSEAAQAAPTAGAQAADQARGGCSSITTELNGDMASRREQLQQPRPGLGQQLEQGDEGLHPVPAGRTAAVEVVTARDASAQGHRPTALHASRSPCTDADGGDGARLVECSTAVTGAGTALAPGALVLEARQAPQTERPQPPQIVLPPEPLQAPLLPRGTEETCTGRPAAEVRVTPMELGGREPLGPVAVAAPAAEAAVAAVGAGARVRPALLPPAAGPAGGSASGPAAAAGQTTAAAAEREAAGTASELAAAASDCGGAGGPHPPAVVGSAPSAVHPERLGGGSAAGAAPGGSDALDGSGGAAGSRPLLARAEVGVAREAGGCGGGAAPNPSPHLLGVAAACPAASRGGGAGPLAPGPTPTPTPKPVGATAAAPAPAAAMAMSGTAAAGSVDVCGGGRAGGVCSGGTAPGAAAAGSQAAAGAAAGRGASGAAAGGAASAGAGASAGAARRGGYAAECSGGGGSGSSRGQGIGCGRGGGGGGGGDGFVGDEKTGSGGGGSGSTSGGMAGGGRGVHGRGGGDGKGSAQGNGGFPPVPPAVCPPPELPPLVGQEWLAWWYVASSVGYSRQAAEVLALARRPPYIDLLKASFGRIMEACCRQMGCVPLHLRVLQVHYIQHAYVTIFKVPQEATAKLANQLLMLIKLFLHEAVQETQRLAEAEARKKAWQTAAMPLPPPQAIMAKPQTQEPVPQSQRSQSDRGLTVEEFWQVMAACAGHCVQVTMLAISAERSGPGRPILPGIRNRLPSFADLLRWGASAVPASPAAAAAAPAAVAAVPGEAPSALPRHLSLLPRFDATLKRLIERLKARKAAVGAAAGGAQQRTGECGLGASGGSTGVPVASAGGPALLRIPQGGHPQQQHAAGPGFGRESASRGNAEQQLGMERGRQAGGGQLRPVPTPASPARWRIRSRQLYSILLRAGSRCQTPADSEQGSTSDSEAEAEAGAEAEGGTQTRPGASACMPESSAAAPGQAHANCSDADGGQRPLQPQGQRDNQGRQQREGGEGLSRAASVIAVPASAAASGVPLDSADVCSAIQTGHACPPGSQAVAEGQAQAVGKSAGVATADIGAAACPAAGAEQQEDPTRLVPHPLEVVGSSVVPDRMDTARPPDCRPPHPGGGGGSSTPPFINATVFRRARRKLALGNWVEAACACACPGTAAAAAEKLHTSGPAGAGGAAGGDGLGAAAAAAAAEAGPSAAQPCTAVSSPMHAPAPTVAPAALPAAACGRVSPAPAEAQVQAQVQGQALPGPFPDLDPALVAGAAFDAPRLAAHVRGLLTRHLLQQSQVRVQVPQGGTHGPSAASVVRHAAGKTAAGVAIGAGDGDEPHPGPPNGCTEATAGAAEPPASRNDPVPAAASGTATAEALTGRTSQQPPTPDQQQLLQQNGQGTGSEGAGREGSGWGRGQQRRLERLLEVVEALPPARLRALYLVSCRLAHGPGAMGGWWAVELAVMSLEELAEAREAAGHSGGGVSGSYCAAAPAAATCPAPAAAAAPGSAAAVVGGAPPLPALR